MDRAHHDVLELARTEQRARVGAAALLRHDVDDLDARGARELGQLLDLEREVGRTPRVRSRRRAVPDGARKRARTPGADRDQDRALAVADAARAALARELLLERR